MPTATEELQLFSRFVEAHTSGSEKERTLSELFDLWMLNRPTASDFAEDVAAINASIQDFRNGQRGTLAGEHSNELRAEFGFNN